MSLPSEYDVVVSTRTKMALMVDELRQIHEQGIKASSDDSEVLRFRGMFRSMQNMFDSFDKLYLELSDMTDPTGHSSAISLEDHVMRTTAKNYLYDCNTLIEELNDKRATSTQLRVSDMGNNTTCCSSSRTKAKLPTIHIIKFNGTRDRWQKFHDTFNSLIIQDVHLSAVDKFHYLESVLEGPAAAVIAGLQVTEANFKIAWEALKSTYDNKRLLAATYLNNLFDITPLSSRPNTEKLTKLIATLSESVAAFKQVGITDPTEFIFFHISCRCLDPQTREAFEISNEKEFPEFKDLIEFLRARCTASELAGIKDVKTATSAPKFKGGKPVLHAANPVTDASNGQNKTTGDCGKIQCNGAGGNPPASLAEVTFDGNGGQDYYDVSLVDGYNLPISMQPIAGTFTGGVSQRHCSKAGCVKDLNAICPSELAVKNGAGKTVACKSACVAFKTDQYCCKGAYQSPEKCNSSNWPKNYPAIFKQACPDAYSYAHDDQSSTFTCQSRAPGSSGYEIKFCP